MLYNGNVFKRNLKSVGDVSVSTSFWNISALKYYIHSSVRKKSRGSKVIFKREMVERGNFRNFVWRKIKQCLGIVK